MVKRSRKKANTLKGKLKQAELQIVEYKKAVNELAKMLKKSQLNSDLLKAMLNNDLQSKLKTRILQVKEFNKAMGIPFLDKPGKPKAEDTVIRLRLLKEEYLELTEAIMEGNITEIAKEGTDLLYILFGLFLNYGLTDKIDEVFNAVHFSNMAKLVDGEVVKNADGKIQKPKGWVKPDIEAILFPDEVTVIPAVDPTVLKVVK